MSPLLETFGAASARAWRLVSTSLGGRGFFALITDSTGTAAQTEIGGMSVSSTGNVFMSIVFAITNQIFHWYAIDVNGNFLYRTNNTTCTVPTNSYSGARALSSASTQGIASSNDTSNSTSFYIIKNDLTQTGVWSRLYSDTSPFSISNGNVAATAMDTSGNIYAASCISGTSPQALVKYNSSGTIQWQRKVTGLSSGSADICVTSSGNPTMANGTSTAISLFQYNTSGVLQWQREIQSASISTNNGKNWIANDSSGNTLVALATSTTGRIVKFSTAGATLWQRQITTISSTYLGQTVVDNLDNVYVLFGGNPGSVIYLLKYNSSGVLQWQRSFTFSGTSSSFRIKQVAFNPAGYITIAGGGITASATILQYPTSGIPTGAFTVSGYTVTIASSALTDAVGSVTIVTAGYTEAAGTGTDSAASVHTTTANSTASNTVTAVV